MAMDQSRYAHLEFSYRGRILTVALNRPDALNAVNAALHSELSRVFYDVQQDADSDIVVLTGNGKAFCAGGDIKWMQDAIDDPAMFERTAVEAKGIFFGQLEVEKPIVCRMNGHATGLGASLALCCDVVFAAENARIGDPHVSVGLVAGDGGCIVWPQLIGYTRAKEYLLTGDLIAAAEAVRLGLINHAVPLAELDAAAYGYAERLANGATKAIRWTKVTANLGLKALAHQIFDTGLGYEIQSNRTVDHQEAVNAFRDKRAPKFTGK
ncbi:MAG: enoyl-CoA hydratase/isomerase family protein [Gammaproteobacteria bacterium]|nr:enoyl-CoA hydratase/isomerase family protein [Gammaproteobacteria bacterium]MBI5615160.1 enoyl-CoA hydratase/isomerase family protein [Gammaproteobacteria bacterium]